MIEQKYIIHQNQSLLEALTQINALQQGPLVLFVVDDEDRMVDVYGLDRTDDPSTFYADWWNALYERR